MSNNQNWYDDDEFDFEDEVEETPQRSSGDDVVKKLRRAERAKDKQLKEVMAELEALRKFQRDSVVTQVLSEKGVNPKIAAFIPQDIESTAEALGSWLDQYGDVFGVQVQQTSEPVQDENINALQQINATVSGAANPEKVNDALSKINNAQTKEDILRIFGQ